MLTIVYEQKKILPKSILESADLVDDLPDVLEWIGPFKAVSRKPDGYEGILAYWEVVDHDDNPIANVFCREAAVDLVRSLNARHERIGADAGPVVVKFQPISG